MALGPGRISPFLPFPLLLALAACSGGGGQADSGGGGGAEVGAEGGDEVYATLQMDHAFPHPFSYLSGVRELPDGTLLAADPASVVLLGLDLEAGVADTLGRSGEGPQEYGQPDHIFPLPGDSSLLVDLGNGRLTVLDPDGTAVGWTSMTRPTEDGSLDLLHPTFVDGAGDYYEVARRDAEAGPPDSAAVVRMNRNPGPVDTVAWLWRPEAGRRNRDAPRPILVPMDDWAVGPDGRVAAVRTPGPSVDWYFPDGRVVTGPRYATESYPVGEAERERESDLVRSSAVISMVTAGTSGVESRSMSRGIPSEMVSEVGMDAFDWPETLPPFQVNGTLVSPNGEAWVTRMMPAGGPGRMEVFDEGGVRKGYVEIPPSSKVIGFGSRPETEGTVYLVRTDEVGLKWLERYWLVHE